MWFKQMLTVALKKKKFLKEKKSAWKRIFFLRKKKVVH